MSRVVVLGAGGWLGSATWTALRDDPDARGFGREALAGASAGQLRVLLDPTEDLVVVNAVGRLRGTDEELEEPNLRFAAQLVEALLGTGAHLVHLGSAAEYGDQGDAAIPETAERRPTSTYGRCKARASDLVLAEPTWCVLRPFNVIDVDMVPENPIAIIRDDVAMADGLVTLPAAAARRDHVSRAFVATSIARAARDRMAGTFNLCSGVGLRYDAIAEAIAARMGVAVQIRDLDRPGIRTVVGSPDAWLAATGMQEALDADGVAGLVLAAR